VEVGKSLSDWKAESLDLERPRSYENEEKELQRVAHELLVEDGTCSGHAGFRRLGSCIELHTVVIAPAFRGTGRSHTLLQASISRWRQDRILNGASVQPKVDLAAAVRGEEAVEKPWRRDMICFTRHPSLAASLIANGFQYAQSKRRWWSLWVRRHPLGQLDSRTMFSLLFNRFLRATSMLFFSEALPRGSKKPGIFRMWFQRRRRLFHQLTYLSGNRLFILESEAEYTPRDTQDGDDMHERLESMGLDISIHTHTRAKSDASTWDESEKDDTPFVDMTQEE
jgi:hypothetical protein|tara:strand:- start:835 stop:1680 length:846 start_codon:yes stop_codon:yes gene_type:complete